MMNKTVVMAVIGALAAGALVSGALVSGATVAFAQADVIKARQENRKATGPEMRAIKAVIDAKGDAKEIIPHAAKLKELEVAFAKMFPPGSDGGDTKALPTVWSDKAGFDAAGKAAEDADDKLAVAAGTGDMAAIGAAFGDVGKSCSGCHTKYRAKLN
jgi:cytochrome c556